MEFPFQVFAFPFELCMFVVGWRHAFRSEWPFIITIPYCYINLPTSFTHQGTWGREQEDSVAALMGLQLGLQ